jgi:hypothetical protein
MAAEPFQASEPPAVAEPLGVAELPAVDEPFQASVGRAR